MSDQDKGLKTAIRDVIYGHAPLQDFQILEADNKGKPSLMCIGDDHQVKPTKRFWTSLCVAYSNYGISMKLAKLFQWDEIFTRIAETVPDKMRLRYALEDHGDGQHTLLAVTHPERPLVQYGAVQSTIANYAAVGSEYGDGVIRSTHEPPHMDDVKIGADGFAHRYVMETPIDGFGSPCIYLSLLRMVCSNGMIGYARAFRSEVSLGKGTDDPTFTLERTLDAFSNEEGYVALQQRYEAAQNSWASIAECQKIYKTVKSMAERSMFTDPGTYQSDVIDDLNQRRTAALGAPISGVTPGLAPAGDDGATALQRPVNVKLMRAFATLTGDLVDIYSLTHLDALSQKKKAQLATRASMYDLLCYVTEAATHYCNEKDGRLLHAEVGNLVSHEFDLEGTMEARPHFTDWFTNLEDSPKLAN